MTGIHVGQWGLDLEPKKSLIDLLKLIDKTDAKTVRIGSLDPNELTDEVIDFLSKSDKFCPHFHLSLQSLNDKILKKMNRHYTFEKIKGVVSKLHDNFDSVFLGCDIIVKPDPDALSKLNNGELAVWAAAWSTTIDPDMYQTYHIKSTATSTKNWGYDAFKSDTSHYKL